MKIHHNEYKIYILKWCSENGYTKIQLELDSLISINMLKNKDTTNLKLKPTILSSIQALTDMNVKISHCYREANVVADFLAELASSRGNIAFYFSYQQLPREVMRIYQLDRCQLPSIRRRYDNSNFFVS
ncbi:hypothetical protein HAX54_023468 [Datura stramonium]|uniref:RNase H type-1 domain-containing protein n=1 Tax=Datura stramonium TaxID=4076 RepID=A0ABS8S720_DATST|nr:hypothetical protein [Datura stramonium]